jgi:hypothetical protein
MSPFAVNAIAEKVKEITGMILPLFCWQIANETVTFHVQEAPIIRFITLKKPTLRLYDHLAGSGKGESVYYFEFFNAIRLRNLEFEIVTEVKLMINLRQLADTDGKTLREWSIQLAGDFIMIL